MTGNEFWVVWIIGWLWTWRSLCPYITHSICTWELDLEDWVMGGFLSLIVSVFAWPVVQVFYMGIRIHRRFGWKPTTGRVKIFAPPKLGPTREQRLEKKRVRDEEREQLQWEQEKENAHLRDYTRQLEADIKAQDERLKELGVID